MDLPLPLVLKTFFQKKKKKKKKNLENTKPYLYLQMDHCYPILQSPVWDLDKC